MINLPAFCIKRPAFTIVITLVMMLIGLIGFMNLPVRWIPNVTVPEITVVTRYPGANASLVEKEITTPIEASLSGITNIESLTSSSKQGQSNISIQFKLGRNMNTAVEDVRTSIERIRGVLPKEAEAPMVIKADASGSPMLFIAFSQTKHNVRELSDYLDKFILPSFETIDGVGSVSVYGRKLGAVRIALDPIKMAASHVSVDEVTRLLQEQNLSLPSGQIQNLDRYYSVITNTKLNTIEQFNELILSNNQNQIVRLKDIADVKLDTEDEETFFRFQGQSALALGIIPQSNANPMDVEKKVQAVFLKLKRTLPAGMQANIVHNQADYIRASIHSVYEALLEAIIFVWLIILIFLKDFRATLIPIITIPVCLISTFAVLYFLNFSINTITLMAFVLAIGLVVDDAIVILENVNRHMEAGMSAMSAALKGSREMVLPVIAMTLTLAAVYAPIAFTSGLLGVLFREFTFTLASAVIISGIIALTLSPMMCARLLKKSVILEKPVIPAFAGMTGFSLGYEKILRYFLSKKTWVMLTLLILSGLGYGIYRLTPSELAPNEDMNEINVHASAPKGSSPAYTDKYVHELEAIYQTIPDIKSTLTMLGINSGSHAYQILKLKPREDRKESASKIAANLALKVNAIPGIRVNVSAPPPPLSAFADDDEGDSVGLVIMTSSDYRQLYLSTQHLIEIIKEIPGFTHVQNRLKWDGQQFEVNIDRNRASDIKVPISSIANTISTLLTGRNVGKTDFGNVILQLNKTGLANPNIIRELYIRNTDGLMVPLSQLVQVQAVTSPETYRHFERLRADTISVSLSPDFKLADAVQTLTTIAQDNLPDDMKFTFVGEAKGFIESTGKTIFTFTLALVFIYLILTAQFESFIDPLIILFTVPFAFIGAIVMLKIGGGSLNIYSHIGLITLIGLIAKHGILITDFANRLRLQGHSIEEAVIEAASLRLRPILMTTAAMILGALPLILGGGPGSESREQIGLVISGGMLCGTFFSLIIVPIMYTYLSPLRNLKPVHLNLEYES